MIRIKIILTQCILLAVFVGLVKNSPVAHRTPTEFHSSCPIYLTISLKSKNCEESQIIINWGPDCQHPPQWIGLYDKDPSIFNETPRVHVDTNHNSSGTFETKVKIGKLNLPFGWNRDEVLNEPPKRNGGKCLPFYVASFDGMVLRSMDCLKIQPNWMSMNQHLMDVPLKNIFIPGTHCSGCYFNRSALRNLLIRKFGFMQNFDVWTQLVLGVRYLDISLGYNTAFQSPHNESRPFWIVNDDIFITPIFNIIEDLRQFVLLSNEMVIIDFHHFPIGFYQHPERHIQFIKYLENKLGDIAFINDHKTNSFDLTINQMTKAGKLLLITYNQPDMLKETDLIWPSLKRYSTKNLKPTEIKEYMRKVFSKKYNGSPNELIGWSFFGTQGVESSYTNGYNLPTSRERADLVNRNISIWLGGPWSLSANVVALDYFFSTNLVDIAIHTNHHKASETSDLVSFDMQDIEYS